MYPLSTYLSKKTGTLFFGSQLSNKEKKDMIKAGAWQINQNMPYLEYDENNWYVCRTLYGKKVIIKTIPMTEDDKQKYNNK